MNSSQCYLAGVPADDEFIENFVEIISNYDEIISNYDEIIETYDEFVSFLVDLFISR